MIRPPNDRINILIRLGLAFAAVAVAILPWVVEDPTVSVWVHAGAAALVVVLILVSIFGGDRLPRLLLDPAMTLATLVFAGHAFYGLISDDLGGGARHLGHGLLGTAATLVAVSQMMARQNDVRLEKRAAQGLTTRERNP